MTSWNEKANTVPTVNVNLKPCACVCRCGQPLYHPESAPRSRGCTGCRYHPDSCTCRAPHSDVLVATAICAAAPLLIPLPIDNWRSVTFTVALGACPTHPHDTGPCEPMPSEPHRCVYGEHPLRTIKVSCSISGKTWEESEVSEASVVEMDSIGRILDAQDNGVTGLAASLVAACRARWALVKALVLGQVAVMGDEATAREVVRVTHQRNAVYAALAKMARCEREYWDAAKAVYVAFPQAHVSSDMQVVDPGDDDGDAPSARWLAAYVEHLIEQIGVLGVAP
jgi:hypothetical protein